jgi:hypothetical protein
MELIKELGLTFMVGVFSILGLETIMHYFFNRPLTGVFQEILEKGQMLRKTHVRDGDSKEALNTSAETRKSDDSISGQAELPHDRLNISNDSQKEHTATVVLFIAAAFTVGIIAEDLSYKYMDSDLPFRGIPAFITRGYFVQRLGLPSEDDDRVSSLIGAIKHPDPQPVIYDLAGNNALRISDQSQIGEKIQNWINNDKRCIAGSPGKDCPSKKEVEKAFTNLFYFAKNTAYSNEHHYDELRKIQARLEFMRSISMIAFIYFALGAVFGVVLLIKRWRDRKNKPRVSEELSQLHSKIPLVLTVMFVVYFLSLWAYARETDAFNRRVFGYLSSSLLEGKRQRKEQLDFEEEQHQRQQRSTNQVPIVPVQDGVTFDPRTQALRISVVNRKKDLN